MEGCRAGWARAGSKSESSGKRAASAGGKAPEANSSLFLFFLIPLTVGFVLYFLTPETPDA